MDFPPVKNVLLDEDRKIRYIVLAYRKLTNQELIVTVRTFLSMIRGRPKQHSTYEILTIIGTRD